MSKQIKNFGKIIHQVPKKYPITRENIWFLFHLKINGFYSSSVANGFWFSNNNFWRNDK
jgi:hypothetical protein